MEGMGIAVFLVDYNFVEVYHDAFQVLSIPDHLQLGRFLLEGFYIQGIQYDLSK
jgi:hypothetical protein